MAEILLITGDHLRHNKFVEFVLEAPEANVVAHVIETREAFVPRPPEDLSSGLLKLWDKHFELRDVAENKYFAPEETVTSMCPQLRVSAAELNSEKTLKFISKFNFDVALVAGSGIIRNPLFSALPEYRVNFHLGLIPYYKGAITMFWPFYFLEPTMAGCTYHVMAEKVDTGHILHQVLPELERGDGMHEVSCKACLAGFRDVGLVLRGIERRILAGEHPTMDPSLETRGRLFFKNDWTPEMLRVIYELYDDDIVDRYLDGNLKCRIPKLIKQEPFNQLSHGDTSALAGARPSKSA